MLAAARLRVEAGERKNAGRRRARALGLGFRVAAGRARRRRKGTENRDRQAGAAARGVDRELGGGPEAFDPSPVLAPLGESLLPTLGLRRGERVRRLAVPPRLVLVYPRAELAGGESRERQQQVAQIALGVDRDHGDAVDGRFFDQRQAQAGLAAAGHADADGVRDQIAGVVEHQVVERPTRVHVELAAEIEQPQLLEVLHRYLSLSDSVPEGITHRSIGTDSSR